MSPWQLFRGSRTNQAALGYRVQHGAAASVHYSIAAAAAAAPDCSRSFCLSREKQTMQQLNGRLASYLQQVQRLEAANQRLELQIQEELNRKCPGELRQLDGHLRRVSVLQNQISDCLSAQAQVKLQLLGAQLNAFDLNARCEQERERRDKMEAELSDLRELEAELKVYKLPELQSLMDNRMQHLVELQTQHQQNVQVLVAQMSGGVAVEMQTAESSDLLRQLEHLRTTSMPVLDRNPNESWFKTQVSTLSSPEVTFDSAMGSDLDEAEVKELRRTAASLTEELTRLQTLISVLEVSGQEQTESFVLQLEALQQKVDGLCRDLDSVLQAIAQQAADYDALLDIKSRLEAEIQNYKRLLDEMNHQRVSNLHLNSQSVTTSPCVTTSPSTFRRNVTVDKTVRVLQGNLSTPEVQTVSKGYIGTVELTPQSEKATAVQVMRDKGKHLKNSPVRSINTANVTHSFSQSVGALPERTKTESLTVKTTVNKESNPVGNEVQTKDCDLQNTLIVQAQISQSVGKEVSVKAPQTEIITTLVHDNNAAIQTEVESSSGITKTETKNEIEIIQTSPHVEPEVKPEPYFKTSDPVKSTATEETETVTLAQMVPNRDSVHANNKTSVQILSYELETTSEVTQTSSKESGSHIHRLALVQDKVFDEITPMEEKSIVIQGKKEEEVVEAEGVPGLGQSLVLSKKIEIEVEEVEVIDDTTEVKVEPIELGNELVCLADKEASISTNITDSEVALSSSGHEEVLSPREADVLISPSPEICLSVENSQIEMIKTSPHAEPEIKPEPHFEISDPDKPTATEETEAVILAQIDSNGDSVHTQMSQTSIEESGSETHKPATVQVEEFHEVTLIDDKDVEIQGQNQVEAVEAEGVPRLGQNSALSKKIEVEVEVISDAVEVKVDSTELCNELVDLAGKEASMSTSLTDSGVALSSSSPEEVLNPREADVLTSPSPETCLSPVETDAVMSITDDQLFFPVDLDEHVGNPDLLPDDPEMFQGPDDCDTCFSPVETETCLNPNDEEDDEDACLDLTEANVHIRPVEKYVLSTKEESQSLSFDGAQEGDRNTKVIMSDREGLAIRPIEGNKEKEVTSSGTNIGSSTQMSRSPRGVELVNPGVQSIIADQEEQVGFGGLYRKSVRDVESGLAGEDKKESMEVDEVAQRKLDRQFVNKPSNSESVGSPNEDATLRTVANKSKEIIVSSNDNAQAVTAEKRFVRGSGEYIVYGGSLGRTSTSNTGGKESQSVSVVPETSQPDTGRFSSRGSGEWMVYGGSLRRKSSLDSRSSEKSEEISSVDSKLGTSAPETGRIGKRGSGEWIVYAGSLGRKTSLDGVSTSSSKGNEGNPSVDSKFAMSPPETGRFGSRGSGEWMAYGGHKSSLAGSNSLPNTETKENQSTSTSERGRFGSTGSGEWRVYSGRISSRPGSDGLPSAERAGSPSVAMQRAFSPPGGGRFGSEGSGEWRVYGGSTGRVSTARGHNGVISPPSSYTTSGSRRSSAGSGSKLSSSLVVKRSSSVGSGGRLSGSGSGGLFGTSTASHSISSSGRYTSTGSGEWKPVYSSVSGRKSTTGTTGWPTSSQRAPSPGGKIGSSGGSGGWLNSSAAGGNRISGSGSGSKLSNQSAGSNERISSIGGGRISSSSGSGRTNSTGGRVITSSDRPIRSTGSGTGGHKERISVCKMAALTISAAGRKKSKDKQKEEQRAQQQPQQAAASSPLLQRWLTSTEP